MQCSGSGARLRRVAGPRRAQFQGEVLLGLGAAEHENPAVRIAMPDHLQHQVRRCAEAGQAEVLPVLQPAQPQRPVADRAGAEQRRGLGVGETIRDAVGEALRDNHQFGVTAVRITSRGAEVSAQVFPARPAELARAAGRVDPRHPHALAHAEAKCGRARPQRRHPAHDLVSQHDRQPRRGRPALDLVQLGVAHPTRRHAHQDLAGARLRVGQLSESGADSGSRRAGTGPGGSSHAWVNDQIQLIIEQESAYPLPTP